MSTIEVMQTNVYFGNQSRYGIEDGRSFSWLVGVSPTTPWVPPESGETSPARFIQSNIGEDWWFDFYLKVDQLDFQSRYFNFHTIGGYPEWFCGGATSPVAMDIYAIGDLDGGTDGTNNRHTHAKRIFQFQVWGGGTWNSADQCFHDIPKRYYQYEIDLHTWYYVRGHVNPAANSSGYLNVDINGVNWFNHSGPVHWPAVPGLVGGRSGFDLFEGLYEAVDTTAGARQATLQQKDGSIQHTKSRWGRTLGAMLADTPTWRTHDSSIIVPGVGTYAGVTFDTGTTIVDSFGGTSPSAPVPTASPIVSGVTQVGHSLSVAGSFSGTGLTFDYLWEKSTDGGLTTHPVGTDSPTYIPVAADVGAIIHAYVQATNAFGSAAAVSAWTVPIRAQGAVVPLTIGKQTVGVSPASFVGPDRERENKFTLPQPGQLVSMFARLDGLAGATSGIGQARLGIRLDAGNQPGNLVAVTNTIDIPAGTQPGVIEFTPTTFPSLVPQDLWLVLHTGGADVIRAYLEGGVGLLPNVDDVFADGLDTFHPYASYSIGDGVMTIYASFAPVAYPFESVLNVFHGNDGGTVSYSALNAAANDAARGALCDAVNPSMVHTVHQRATNDYAFHARVASAPAPPANWWN